MHKRTIIQAAIAGALLATGPFALAQDNVFKIGLVLPLADGPRKHD